MKNMKLTTNGLQILKGGLADGETRFWIGYYGLAYVPDREQDSLDDAATQGKITTTPFSDRIYNIWQGDMLNGYAQDNPEDSAAASLFGLTMYDKSIRTNYRYVYDTENECNRLVAWKSVNTGHGENTLARIGAAIYTGGYRDEENGLVQSNIPVPAPLYYKGEPGVNQSIADSLDAEKVSSDFRYYQGISGRGEYGWDAAEETYDGEVIYTPDNLLQSVSNFNRFHGTASSEGYGVSSVSSCHNMSKATKLFPINYYQVVNDNGKKLAETKYSENSPARKPLATGIKFSIDLSPVTVDTGYTALEYEAGNDAESKELYESKYTSFRFNRIGIYAVKMTVHHYATDTLAGDCSMQKVQFEIDGDSEPVLFAVADVNDVIISDDPSSKDNGVAKFTLDFILNLDPDTEGDLERRTAVYYNLYENDATTWYKNQLLASASLSEAVTDISLEMNAIKQHLSDKRECCSNGGAPSGNTSSESNTYIGLRNLVDGVDKEGSVRGIDTFDEGDGSNIPPVSGSSGNAPSGTVNSTSIDKVSAVVDGRTITVPSSYLYSLGYTGGDKSSPKISVDQLKVILETKGVTWLHENLVTESGWYMNGHGGRSDMDFLFIWTSGTTYAKISLETGELTEYTVGPSEESRYYTEVIIKAATESMFADGYSIGQDTVVLGRENACAGDYSLVQGTRIYVGKNNGWSTVLGSTLVTIDKSDDISSNSRLTVLNASNLRIFDSDDSLICAGGDGFANGMSSNIVHVSQSIIGGGVSDIGNMYRTFMLGSGHTSYYWSGTPYKGDDITPHTKRSLLIDPTLEYICTVERYAYRKFIGSEYAANEPYIENSEVIGGTIFNSVSNSLVLGNALALSHFSINSIDHTNWGRMTTDNIIVGGDSLIGEGAQQVLALCGGSKIPNYSTNVIEIGGGNEGYAWYDDIAMTVDDFNAEFTAGTLKTDAHYAIMGSGTIPVWDGTTHNPTVLIYGDHDVFYGVYVDAEMHVSYTPQIETLRYMPSPGSYPIFMYTTSFVAAFHAGTLIAGVYYALIGEGQIPTGVPGDTENVDLEYPVDGVYYGISTYMNNYGEVGVSYTPSTMHISTRLLGNASAVRRNPQDNTNLLLIGDGNYIGGDKRNVLSIGAACKIEHVRSENLLMIGDVQKICPYYSSSFDPQTGKRLPYVYNTVMVGNGISLDLGSPEEFATATYGNSLILLGEEYNSCQEMYGIFSHPVEYSSRPYFPNSTYPPFVVYANTSSFRIDPYMFENFKKAAEHFTDESTASYWFQRMNKYDHGQFDPSDLGLADGHEFNEYALSIASDEDVYRPSDAGGSPTFEDDPAYRDPFKGLTRGKIREMINKPNAPMVYTGGVCFAGVAPSGGSTYTGTNNYGLIKLGHYSKPVAYIKSSSTGQSIDAWAERSSLLSPVSITGTVTCPYGGMVLAVDNQQEVDGTMHLVLRRGITGDFLSANSLEDGADCDLIPGYLYTVEPQNTIHFKAKSLGDSIIHLKSHGSCTISPLIHTNTTYSVTDAGNDRWLFCHVVKGTGAYLSVILTEMLH